MEGFCRRVLGAARDSGCWIWLGPSHRVCVCVLIRGLWVKIYTHFFFLGWCMVDISNCWREPMASRPISISCLFKQIATMFKEESNSWRCFLAALKLRWCVSAYLPVTTFAIVLQFTLLKVDLQYALWESYGNLSLNLLKTWTLGIFQP